MRNPTKFIFGILMLFCFLSCENSDKTILAQNSPEPEHFAMHAEAGQFIGWPANNGIWKWEDGEIMLGFTRGEFAQKSSHDIGDENRESWLAKSKDGGSTWETFKPKGFVVDSAMNVKYLPESLNFEDKDFALRLAGTGYHGSKIPEGGFFYTLDRGNTWEGPFGFNGLSEANELEGMELTPRSDYLIEDSNSALFFMAARIPNTGMTDKPFVARTRDGGKTFEFVEWMIEQEDPYRGVMPATVKTSEGKLISAIRRRDVEGEHKNLYCWIDIYTSEDNGESWDFLSRGGETGIRNGNPPAMIILTDGRLLLAYGNREHQQIRVRVSSDEGKTWGPEIVLRQGEETDIGYPRMVQNEKGEVIVFYYWADSADSEKYIAATVFDPDLVKNWSEPVKLSDQ